MISERENFLRALEFRNPQWIPCSVGFSLATWRAYHKELEEIRSRYPRIFPAYAAVNIDFHQLPPRHREKEYFRDNWGCLWYNVQSGLEGQVVENPLADWKAFNTYKPPDPLFKAESEDRDWEKIKKDIQQRKEKGLLTIGNGERLFDRLYFLRGFENLMMDIATDDQHLPRLIEMLLDYELKLVDQWLQIGVDTIGFHSDIGTQNSLMISPQKFRKYIKPMFKKIFSTCRDAGTHVLFSSDGRLLEIVDDLVECGVSLHDPQHRANTIEGIAAAYKGKMCIFFDLDRQMFPFCKPADIKKQVKDAVEMLNSPEGGFMIYAQIFGTDVPMENIEAICQAFEEYCLAG